MVKKSHFFITWARTFPWWRCRSAIAFRHGSTRWKSQAQYLYRFPFRRIQYRSHAQRRSYPFQEQVDLGIRYSRDSLPKFLHNFFLILFFSLLFVVFLLTVVGKFRLHPVAAQLTQFRKLSLEANDKIRVQYILNTLQKKKKLWIRGKGEEKR